MHIGCEDSSRQSHKAEEAGSLTPLLPFIMVVYEIHRRIPRPVGGVIHS